MSPLFLFKNVIEREQGLHHQCGGFDPRAFAPCSSDCESRSLPKLATASPCGDLYRPSDLIDRHDAEPTRDRRKWMVPSGLGRNPFLATVQSLDSR